MEIAASPSPTLAWGGGAGGAAAAAAVSMKRRRLSDQNTVPAEGVQTSREQPPRLPAAYPRAMARLNTEIRRHFVRANLASFAPARQLSFAP